jgi:hypothetical protein
MLESIGGQRLLENRAFELAPKNESLWGAIEKASSGIDRSDDYFLRRFIE